MKCSILEFTTELARASNCSAFLLQNLFKINAEVDFCLTALPKIDLVLKAFQNLNKPNHVFVLCEEDALKSFRVKKAIAKYLEIGVEDSPKIKAKLEQILVQNNVDNEECLNYYKAFTNCEIIELNNTYLLGQKLEKDNTIYHFLPSNLMAIQNYVLSLLEEIKNSNNFTTKLYKTFGLTKQEIHEKLKFVREEFKEIFFEIFGEKLNLTLRITAKEFVEKERVLNCLEKVETTLNSFIYSNNNSIYLEVINKLKQKRVNLCLTETITGGQISANLNKESENGLNNIIETVVPSSLNAKRKRLGITPETAQTYSLNSAEMAYEMATGVLENYPQSIVLTTSGETAFENNTATMFMAVGNMDAIHVYKHQANGTREEILEELSMASMFYLIKFLNKI